MMTVKDLRALLAGVEDERPVILAKDSEGNGFSPVAEASLDLVYVPYTRWVGETHIAALTAELRAQGFTDEDLYHGDTGQLALVLWPCN